VAPAGCGPGAPLESVDRPEVAVRVGPLVPDGDAVLVQIANVGVAPQKPEQLVNDRLDVHPLRGDEREARGEIEPELRAEDAAGASARPVRLWSAVVEHVLHQIEVAAHSGSRGDYSTGAGGELCRCRP